MPTFLFLFFEVVFLYLRKWPHTAERVTGSPMPEVFLNEYLTCSAVVKDVLRAFFLNSACMVMFVVMTSYMGVYDFHTQ